MSTAIAEKLYTPAEYLALERAAKYKSEYLAGRIFAMAGASREHNLIATRVAGTLDGQLRGRTCEAYGSDMRIYVEGTGLYTYPDASVACPEIRFQDEETDTLLAPTVIIEVLSKSTEAYDRGDKFAHYRRIPSLREYILIAQDRPRVERYVRDGEDWVLTEFSGTEAEMELTSIGCRLTLADVYEKVRFETNVEELRPTTGEQ